MPRDWPGFELTYRYRSSIYKIRVERDANAGESGVIRLVDDGATHEQVVRVADRKPALVDTETVSQAAPTPDLIAQL
jgi:cellobiose phosphorylase